MTTKGDDLVVEEKEGEEGEAKRSRNTLIKLDRLALSSIVGIRCSCRDNYIRERGRGERDRY